MNFKSLVVVAAVTTAGLAAAGTSPAAAYGAWQGPDFVVSVYPTWVQPQAHHRHAAGRHRASHKSSKIAGHAKVVRRRAEVPHGNLYRYRGGGALPGPCYLARRQGGSCGCVAMGHIFGRYDHVLNGMNLWLARTWLGFPRSSPKPGTAAVWGTHHVEAVVADNGDGTITTSGPYGNRRVKIASVAIVDPRGGYVGHREGHSRYAYRHWQHRRYARAW
jgi:hypothetical protein